MVSVNMTDSCFSLSYLNVQAEKSMVRYRHRYTYGVQITFRRGGHFCFFDTVAPGLYGVCFAPLEKCRLRKTTSSARRPGISRCAEVGKQSEKTFLNILNAI